MLDPFDPLATGDHPGSRFDHPELDEMRGAFWWERVLIVVGSLVALGVVAWLIGALTG